MLFVNSKESGLQKCKADFFRYNYMDKENLSLLKKADNKEQNNSPYYCGNHRTN